MKDESTGEIHIIRMSKAALKRMIAKHYYRETASVSRAPYTAPSWAQFTKRRLLYSWRARREGSGRSEK